MDAVAQTIAVAVDRMAGSHDPWWIIGSAAAWLHGGATGVADVDLLIGVGDAERLFGLTARSGHRSEGLFRSSHFGRLQAAPLPIEVMAGLHVRDDDGWHPIVPRTRQTVKLSDRIADTPDRAELIAILRRFGRPKDHERAAVLMLLGSH